MSPLAEPWHPQRIKVWHYQAQLCQPLLIPAYPDSATDQREGLLLEAQGPAGQRWAEASPLPGFSSETLAALIDATPQAIHHWHAHGLASPETPASLAFALSTLNGPECHESSPRQTPMSLPISRLLTAQTALETLPQGANVKVKVGPEDITTHFARLTTITHQRPDLILRLDANRRWSQDAVYAAMQQPWRGQIDYFEEPCPTAADQYALAEAGMPIALDETLHEPSFDLAKLAHIRALVIKPTLWGSLDRLRPLIAAAQQQHCAVVFSSSFEACVAAQQLRQLAHHYSPNTPAGLDTEHWWPEPLLAQAGAAEGGWALRPSSPLRQVKPLCQITF